MSKFLTLIAVLALAALGLAACGGGDDETSAETTATEETTTAAGGGGGGGGGGAIKFEADPNGALAYTQTEVSGPAGDDTIDFTNDSSTPHDVTIEDSGGNQVAQTEVITGDSTSTTANLAAGTYTFFCSVDGHEAAGMKGTLTIE
jgi:plastocyanin